MKNHKEIKKLAQELDTALAKVQDAMHGLGYELAVSGDKLPMKWVNKFLLEIFSVWDEKIKQEYIK